MRIASRTAGQFSRSYRATFDAVEKAYGVDRHFIAAIWGVESNYSTQIGERSVIRSTATLACIGRRQDYFREEFLSALEILARGDVQAGAPQGLVGGRLRSDPIHADSFKRYAVDFDGDGRRDVVDSVPDLVASTANNLKKDGWVSGQTWGYEVELPTGFQFPARRPLACPHRAGVGAAGHPARRRQGLPARRRPRLSCWSRAGAQGPGFLMLQNFRVIMKYNPAEAYALAIGYLADRLRGGEPFVQAWPRHERVLTRAERYELQQHLAARGYDVGEPDGRSEARPVARCATSNPRSGRCPTGSPRRRSWSGCAAGSPPGGIFKLTFFGYITRQMAPFAPSSWS